MVVFNPGDAHGKGVRRLWPALAGRRNAAGGADSVLRGKLDCGGLTAAGGALEVECSSGLGSPRAASAAQGLPGCRPRSARP